MRSPYNMKLYYLQNYPPLQAIDRYVKKKIWKLGNPEHPKHHLPLQTYLSTKVEPFVQAFPKHLRQGCKDYFFKVILRSKPVVCPKPLTTDEWFEIIASKLEVCFFDLQLCNHKDKNEGYGRTCCHNWSDSDMTDFVTMQWHVHLTNGRSPLVIIISLKSGLKGKGRAISITRAIVEALQTEEVKNPYGCINLTAFTGQSPYLGTAIGGYTWAMLGFGVKEYTKLEKRMRGYNPDFNLFKSLQEVIISYLQATQDRIYPLFKETFLLHGISPSQHEWVCEAKKRVETCETAWDLASITLFGFRLGKFLMSSCDAVLYNAVLYPNLPNSLEMNQFRMRVGLS